jgi:hypothetical protein
VPFNEAQLLIKVNGQAVDKDKVAPLIKGIEVRESDRDTVVASVRFRLQQDDQGKYTPLDDKIFTPAQKLEIDVGAPGQDAVPLFVGFISHVRPHFERIEANCYVEVLGMDASMVMDAEEQINTYPDMTDSDAASKIFQKYQLSVTAEKSDAKHEEKKLLLVQRSTDWKFVQMLARRNGYVCFLQPDKTGTVKATWGPRAVSKPAQLDLSPQMPNASLTWIDFQTVFMGPVRYIGSAFDPFEKKVFKGEGKEKLAQVSGGSKVGGDIESGLTNAGATKAQRLLRDPLPFDQAITAESTGRTDNALFVTEARGEIDSAQYRNLLRAGLPVNIKDVGKEYASEYYVRSVRTVVNEGIMSQTFIAEKNSTGQGSASFGKSEHDVGGPQ